MCIRNNYNLLIFAGDLLSTSRERNRKTYFYLHVTKPLPRVQECGHNVYGWAEADLETGTEELDMSSLHLLPDAWRHGFLICQWLCNLCLSFSLFSLLPRLITSTESRMELLQFIRWGREIGINRVRIFWHWLRCSAGENIKENEERAMDL